MKELWIRGCCIVYINSNEISLTNGPSQVKKYIHTNMHVCMHKIHKYFGSFFFWLVDISNAFYLGEWTIPLLPPKKERKKSQ